MNIKFNVIVDAWIGQILVTGWEVGIFMVLEVIGDFVVGKVLVVFSKGLLMFNTSSNCRCKSLSEKEYHEYAHNTIK